MYQYRLINHRSVKLGLKFNLRLKYNPFYMWFSLNSVLTPSWWSLWTLGRVHRLVIINFGFLSFYLFRFLLLTVYTFDIFVIYDWHFISNDIYWEKSNHIFWNDKTLLVLMKSVARLGSMVRLGCGQMRVRVRLSYSFFNRM